MSEAATGSNELEAVFGNNKGQHFAQLLAIVLVGCGGMPGGRVLSRRRPSQGVFRDR